MQSLVSLNIFLVIFKTYNILINSLGVVRHNDSGFWKFIDLGGINLIVNALKSPSDKLKIKAAFLIVSTCPMGKDVAGKLY